jgi:hypothetical protein
MKIIIVVLISIACFVSVVSAQSENNHDTTSFAGRKAVLFSVYGLIGNINLSGGLGGKYWISNEFCFRSNITGNYYNSSSEDPYGGVRGHHSESVGIHFDLLRRISLQQQLVPYVGFGVGYSWGESVDSNYGSEGASVGVNCTLLCGVEYMVIERVSLSAEQAILAQYTHSHGTYKNTYWNVGNSTSTISLSIYF